jgi:hypothetical protein
MHCFSSNHNDINIIILNMNKQLKVYRWANMLVDFLLFIVITSKAPRINTKNTLFFCINHFMCIDLISIKKITDTYLHVSEVKIYKITHNLVLTNKYVHDVSECVSVTRMRKVIFLCMYYLSSQRRELITLQTK